MMHTVCILLGDSKRQHGQSVNHERIQDEVPVVVAAPVPAAARPEGPGLHRGRVLRPLRLPGARVRLQSQRARRRACGPEAAGQDQGFNGPVVSFFFKST